MSDAGAGRSRDALSWAGVPEDLAPPDREAFLRHGDRSLARRAVDDTAAYLILCAAVVVSTPIARDHAVLSVGTILGFAAIGGARFVLSRSFERTYDRAPDQWRRTFGVTTLGLAGLWALFSFSIAAWYGLQIPSLLVMFATAALSAAAVSALCSNRRLLTAFLLLMLAPIALAAALPGQPQSYTMCLVVALYCAVLVQEGRYQSRHYWASVGNLFRLRARSAELERARAHAENASRAKSDFLAHMSHEIRTPLNGLLGMLYLMLETPLSSVQREYADTIQRSADSLMGVLNEILDLSKIEAGRMTLDTADFDLRELVEETGALVAPGAHAKGVEVIVRVPPGFPRLRGDAKRLREVLTNLTSNAVKFTERGEVAIEVELLEPGEARASFRITVRDTGIGIPLDRQSAVFQGFTQAEGSTFRRFGGTGLGLAISKQLLTLMGGTLELESEPGRGTTFRIALALEKAAVDAVAARTYGPRMRGVRVLVVDDHSTSLRNLEEQLRALGCEVECAGGGRAALAALEQHERSAIALVLLDAAMPEMDGLVVARAMRDEPRFRAIPVVLMQTAGAEPDPDHRHLGISASVTKPVRLHHLLRALAAATGAPAEPPAAVETPKPESASLATLGLRVLFAEDHTVNQAVAVRMCERLGVRADVAANGREAVTAVGRRRYDAVLMDLQMPEMDGLEATREIRRIEAARGGHLPIIALTAHAMASELDRCLAAGMDDCISKPVHPDELSRTLRKWCLEDAGARSGADPATSPWGAALEAVPAVGARQASPDAGHGPPPPASLAAVLDVDQLLRVSGDDPDFERQLRDDFLASLPPLLADAQTALEASDGLALRALAHRLKGSSRTLGGDAVGDACEELEKTAERRSLEGAAEALWALRSELTRMEGALRSRGLKAA
jgi:two-component system sensor histidine kinase/response regulator